MNSNPGIKVKPSRTDLLNQLIKRHGYKHYLEIGTQHGINYKAVVCAHKTGVDPDPQAVADLHMPSDDYFTSHPKHRYDIVFIDGLHHSDQVQRDIEHALAALNPGGIIVCHDMLPKTEEGQRVPRETKVWYGDCWKAFVRLRKCPDLFMCTIQICTGLGILRPGSQVPLNISESELTYAKFLVNRQTWMNIKPYDYVGSL